MSKERRLIRILASIATVLLTACASHPPMCKGPYTPINDPTSAAAHDPQR
jgi:starvation-inducible outer membrane lipoprotein